MRTGYRDRVGRDDERSGRALRQAALRLCASPRLYADELGEYLAFKVTEDRLVTRLAAVEVTRQTIVRLEQDTSRTQERTLRDVRKVFEDMGIEFPSQTAGVGLRMRDV